MFCIEEELKKLPEKPGVYIMHDAQTTSFMWERRYASAAGYARISGKR